eukprot:CAMPEP_0201592156 /NCGR_PEP_ID=MMETSP0190_2-20130828/190123_1 /ASSEMBLY_ACC=CAM_ASM_000263 /TAXON_ID=37353 /ORGANISM="Rosalina sp." /LENGTH=1157 /DNA_ID=CAMNT_0048050791 /DNA_START=48 /DNA_END=3521 /DNA_ORIENTATION=-
MPLSNGRAIKFVANPPDIPQTDKVFQIRFTGEIFKTYQEYSARLDYYREPKFSCKYTGKSGFNYENAIDHENQIKKEISSQFPQEYLPLIFKEIQYSQLKLTELTNKIYEKCLSEFKIKNNIKDEPEKEPTKITAFLQPQAPQLEAIPNNNEKKEQKEQKEKKKPKKKTFKHPFKKHLIRTQIRVAANQQHFKNAPWILHHDIATKYDINAEMPQSLKIIIDEYIKKQNEKNKPKQPKKKKEKKVKTKREKKPKAKKEKKEKIKEEKPPKPESLIASLCIKSEPNKSTKSLKYPCDDQLLLMYDKMDNEKLIAYDTFWNKIQKIGFNQIQNQNDDENKNENDNTNNNNYQKIGFNQIIQNDDENKNENDNTNNNNYSNLAFFDYNTIYDHDRDHENDEDMDIDIAVDSNRNALKHRQLNDLFNEIWKLWSFIECYHSELDITPFPISFLMDSLCYDKRCILLDEIQVSLLEVIRRHCITTIAERIEERKEEEIKKIKARKKQQKANKRKAERDRKRKAAKEAKAAKKSEKEEADDSEDDEEESSEDEEMSSSEEEESSSEEETDSDSEDEDEDIDIDIPEPQWDENSLFTDEPLSFFKLDLLREYLRFRCSSKEEKEEIKDDTDKDEQEIMDIDEKDEEEDVDHDMNTDDLMNDEEDDEEEQEPLLPEYEYALNDEIWDRLNNIRSYVTLPIESKLEILKILFQDAMSTNVLSEIMTERIEKYPDYKQTSKELDDEYNVMVKEEKLKLREIRSELITKKRILNPKRSKSKKTKKPTAASSSSSNSASVSLAASGAGSNSNSSASASSGSGSKSNSNSPNKENNGSRANSRSDSDGDAVLKEASNTNTTQQTATATAPRITSRQQIMLAKKEQKEREIREREEAFMKEREYKQQQASKRKEQQEKEALKQEIQTMSDNVKNATNLMNERIKQKQAEIMKKKYELSLECRTYLHELGADRFNNRYFWNNYSDGRIFIYHSNGVYHNKQNKDKDCLITKEILKISQSQNEMKCGNEWEMITDDNGNQFCWSFISTTTKFYELLNVLDSRGLRESELLLMLNALKSDIVASMKMIGNDDYKEIKESMDLDGNDGDDNHNRSQSETSSNTEDAPLRRSNRRKSTRTRKSTRSTNNAYRTIEPPYKQFANKGFLSYKNMVKRK